MTKIKICGLTRLCDSEAANMARPDYIGFVFAPSRRQIEGELAAALKEKLLPSIMAVGVFVNETAERICSLTDNRIIDMIQLHGEEDETYIRNIKALTGKPVIKAVAVQHKGDVQKWENTQADFLLLDQKQGGSGQLFNWRFIGKTSKPFFLAGGLHIGNVTAAVEQTNPFAIDISSGVETNGWKDPQKIMAITRRIRNE